MFKTGIFCRVTSVAVVAGMVTFFRRSHFQEGRYLDARIVYDPL